MTTKALAFSNDRNVNLLSIGDATVLFSYDATVAFSTGDQSYVNPRYVGYSKTTSKHLSQYGFSKATACDTEQQFHAYLADALRRAAEFAQTEVCEAIARAI